MSYEPPIHDPRHDEAFSREQAEGDCSAATCSPPVTRFAFAVAILDDALASNRVPHVRTDIVTVDAPSMEHASGVVLQQVLFECAMKRPQSALLHYRVMDVERLSKANAKLSDRP